MDWQTVFYAVVPAAFGVVGYSYNEIKTKLNKTHDDFLIYKTHVAEQYVKNEALEKLSNALFAKLDRIENKVFSIGQAGGNSN